jgi:hypothetical protein
VRSDISRFPLPHTIEPEWVRALQQADFSLYKREGKEKMRLFFPGGNPQFQQRSFHGKPYRLVAPPGDV